MSSHILLPVDLAGPYQPTLDAVRSLVSDKATQVTLLHVVETLQDVPFEEMEEFYAELRARARAKLSDWARELKAEFGQVSCEVVYGSRVSEVVQFVEHNNVELIVLRSRPFDRDQPADTFGTLSHQIALMAPCSVLLVR